MLRATTIVRKAAVRADRIAGTVTLDHAARRLAGETPLRAGNLAVLAAPAKAVQLEDGDALRLEDGRLVLVRAAEEALLAVRADNPARLLRLAWQLGSNHVASEVDADVLYVVETAASAELARNSGCATTPVRRPFRPEPEVHAHDHAACGHDHGHHHPHDHAHAHAHHDHAHHDHAHHDHAHRDGHDHAHHDHARHDHHGHGHGHEHDH